MSSTSDAPSRRLRDLPMLERRRVVAAIAGLGLEEVDRALALGGLDDDVADRMVENALGTLALPFGVAENVRVNGVDYVVPMATEEPSVIAATSHASKRVRAGGGFTARYAGSLMAAQIEVHDVAHPAPASGGDDSSASAVARVLLKTDELLAAANAAIPGVVERGGGARAIEARDLGEGYVVVHAVVDCLDAMGANLLNTVAEALGPRIAELAGGELGLRILSNYCDRRTVHVSATLPVDALTCSRATGLEAARGVARASRFAELDVYRAVTHNKGIMNGIDAVVIATGNDSRAVEAAAHAFAARSGRYAPLAVWRLSADERTLTGELEVPLALGVVGGALRAHRGAALALAILGAKSAGELAMVAAAAGLATNLAALRALATEGIQRGHMALHHRATGGSIPPRASQPPSRVDGGRSAAPALDPLHCAAPALDGRS